MPELDPVSQEFSAQASEYLAVLDEIIAKAEEVALATKEAEDAIAAFAIATDDAAVLMGAAAGRADDLASAISSVARSTAPADAALGVLDGKLDQLIALGGQTVGELHDIRDAMAGVALAAAAMAASTSTANAATDAGTVAGTRWAGVWNLTGNAIHWIVMGTLEVASTAIPALVAFGAAAVAMTPAFTFLKDQMTNLVISSGSLTGALLNSVGPLHQMALGLGQVQQSATPDAFIIFGSAISIVTTHMGVFSGVAKQASDVLATFASKIANELSGPAGQQLAGFFANAVKYMVQWGQVLGNLGHTFVNAVSAMWGVGQVLLDVLVLISHALLVISSNPVGAWFIGVAAGMSALYRYGTLLVTVFNWLGGSALVRVIAGFAGWAVGIAAITTDLGVMAGAAQAAGDIMDLALGPVGLAIAAISVGLGIWYLATRHAASATQTLIAQVQSMPPTVMNLSSGIVTLSGALAKSQAQMTSIKAAAQASGTSLTSFASAGKYATDATTQLAVKQDSLGNSARQVQGNISALSAALTTQAGKLAHLDIALAQAGATAGLTGSNMLALSIQTDLQDSKVQALNQAWDQYFGILSGGMSSVAAFSTSLTNIGQVAGTTTNNLGTATGTMNLSVAQFAHQLSLGAVKGAAAWTNFSQITQSTIPAMIDQFRTYLTAGAISTGNFSKSILDMIAPLMQFAAKGGPAAQAILVGIAQAAGDNIKTFPQLEAWIKKTGASTADLNKQATAATIAMSQMNNIAKNLSNTLSVQEANAIANAALKASGFTTDINNMMKAEQTHATVGGLTWQQWAAKAAAAQQQVQADAAKSVAAIQKIQNAENALHDKLITITVNTVYHTTGTASAAALGSGSSGGAKPGLPSGMAYGGYIDGYGSKTSDSNLIRASHGEYMVSAAAVDYYGRATLDALNARRFAAGGAVSGSGTPVPSVAAMGGGGGGALTLNQNQRFEVRLDNALIGAQQRRQVLTYARRNPSANWNLTHGRRGQS